MNKATIMEVTDDDILDFSKLLPLSQDTFTFKICEKVKTITLTSNNITCNINILIGSRNDDLVINIYNLSINSSNKIALDFTAGDFCNYKSYIIFSGKNYISSSNLPICITNNQTIEFKGISNGSLDICSLSYLPALGNTPEHAGNAHISFSGEGYISIYGYTNLPYSLVEFNSNEKWFLSAINISHKNIDEISSISIKDKISIKIIGGSNLHLNSNTSLSSSSLLGGAAISVDYFCLIEKKGSGVLELLGGIGDIIGPCISLNGGFIKLSSPCILSSTLTNNLNPTLQTIPANNSTTAILLISKNHLKTFQISKFHLIGNITINTEHILCTNTNNFHVFIDDIILNNTEDRNKLINYTPTSFTSINKKYNYLEDLNIKKKSFFSPLIKLYNFFKNK